MRLVPTMMQTFSAAFVLNILLNAGTLHISGIGGPDRDHSPPVAVVGRAGHRGSGARRSSPDVLDGASGRSRCDLRIAQSRLLAPADASGDSFPAAGIRQNACRHGHGWV